jgi:hypothetical protein
MKRTRYFEAISQRPDRAIIKQEWIERVIADPMKEVIQQDGRIRRWGVIEDLPASEDL